MEDTLINRLNYERTCNAEYLLEIINHEYDSWWTRHIVNSNGYVSFRLSTYVTNMHDIFREADRKLGIGW